MGAAAGGFKKIPWGGFLVRVLPAAAGVLVISYFAMRAVAPASTLGGWLLNVQEICQPGVAQSEYNQERCRLFWNTRYREWGVALIPLWLAIGYLLLALDSLKLTYRKIQKRIDGSKVMGTGTVTAPARAWNDFFGWYRCFKAVQVELADGSQIRVYLPVDVPVPLPGQKLALIEIPSGKSGKKRFAGILYAPHIAVMRGV